MELIDKVFLVVYVIIGIFTFITGAYNVFIQNYFWGFFTIVLSIIIIAVSTTKEETEPIEQNQNE